jgi:hypothetical protein
MCALVAERIDAERLERRAFTEAIGRATRPPTSKVAGPSQIIGGTFFATSEVADETDISVIDTNGDSSGPGTTIEVSTNGVHHQEVGDPRA